MMIVRICCSALALVAALGVAGTALAQVSAPPSGPSACGGFPPIENGPHDYRVVRDARLKVVEMNHFTPGVESLTKGQSTVNFGGDIAFTLRHFPNHHRALLSMIRLTERLKTPQPPGSEYTVDCWLDRAVRFKPDDAVARMIFVSYLDKRGRTQEALAHLETAVTAAGENAFTHYNAGLLFFEMKQYQRALEQAHRALALGLNRVELRERLRAAGHWKDASSGGNEMPAPPVASIAASAQAGASPASKPIQ